MSLKVKGRAVVLPHQTVPPPRIAKWQTLPDHFPQLAPRRTIILLKRLDVQALIRSLPR